LCSQTFRGIIPPEVKKLIVCHATGETVLHKAARLGYEVVDYLLVCSIGAFSALTLLVGRQEGHPACKKLWGIVGVGAPTRTIRAFASIIFPCSIKIQKTGGGETQPERSTALC